MNLTVRPDDRIRADLSPRAACAGAFARGGQSLTPSQRFHHGTEARGASGSAAGQRKSAVSPQLTTQPSTSLQNPGADAPPSAAGSGQRTPSGAPSPCARRGLAFTDVLVFCISASAATAQRQRIFSMRPAP